MKLQHATKFHKIEVKVIGRPQLIVKVRRGFFDVDPEPVATKSNKTKTPVPANKPEEADFRKKLNTTFPQRDIPISLNLNYVNTSDRGWMLSSMMEVPSSFLTFENVGGKQVAAVDVAGVFYNDKGQSGSSFTKRVTVEVPAGGPPGGAVRYSYPVFLQPGLYHVRVGAKDAKSGRIGSAHGWIEIPNLQKTQLGLSSVLIGVRPSSAMDNTAETSQTLGEFVGVEHLASLQRNSDLRFVIFIYNATLAPAPDSKADIALQVQFIRDDQPVVTTPLKKIPTENIADASRILYAAEIPLAGLPAGRYLMQVTIIDRTSKQSSMQQTRFEIE